MKYVLRISALVLCLVQGARGITKNEQEVFGKWIRDQRVFSDCSLLASDYEEAWRTLLARFNKYRMDIECYTPFINDVSAGCFFKKDQALVHRGRKTMKRIYNALDGDIADLQNCFSNPLFLNAYPAYQDGPVEGPIARYRKLFKLFLYHPDKQIRLERGFALANRMFDYCFGKKTVASFCSVLADKSKHALAELFYSTMWYNLVSEGWRHWHTACLKAVKKEYDQGREVVYVAGGNDIYQLFKNGIFRIRIIDPMLPSQPEYYAEGWDWLIANSLGDRLTLNLDNKKLVMERIDYQEKGTFKANLSTGVCVDLPKSTTRWNVYEDDKSIGYVIFERRFCDKKDFQASSMQTLLMSFNEMYFVALPAHMRGWGIGIDNMPKNIKIHVKQLRKPLDKTMMAGIVQAEKQPFNFIFLGSCAT